MDLVGSMFSDNPEILSGRISPEQTQELQSYIESVLTNNEEIQRMQLQAIRSGRSTTRERTDTQQVLTNYGAAIQQFKDFRDQVLADASTTQEEKRKELQNGREAIIRAGKASAKDQGFSDVGQDFYTLLDELIEESFTNYQVTSPFRPIGAN